MSRLSPKETSILWPAKSQKRNAHVETIQNETKPFLDVQAEKLLWEVDHHFHQDGEKGSGGGDYDPPPTRGPDGQKWAERGPVESGSDCADAERVPGFPGSDKSQKPFIGSGGTIEDLSQ